MYKEQEAMNAFRIAAEHKHTAQVILDDLHPLERRRQSGRPVIVGAMAYDVMIDPDIDVEIYCPKLSGADGFRVLGASAENPKVIKIKDANELLGRDRAFYRQIRYRTGKERCGKSICGLLPKTMIFPEAKRWYCP